MLINQTEILKNTFLGSDKICEIKIGQYFWNELMPMKWPETKSLLMPSCYFVRSFQLWLSVQQLNLAAVKKRNLKELKENDPLQWT